MKSANAPRDIFTAFLRQHGQRVTYPRLQICDLALSLPRRFSAADLKAALDNAGDCFPFATIYSTLDLLVQASILSRIRFCGHALLYEKSTRGNHTNIHLVCEQCGKIKIIKDPDLAAAIAARRYPTFSPSAYTLNIYGICSVCRRKQHRSPNIKQK